MRNEETKDQTYQNDNYYTYKKDDYNDSYFIYSNNASESNGYPQERTPRPAYTRPYGSFLQISNKNKQNKLNGESTNNENKTLNTSNIGDAYEYVDRDYPLQNINEYSNQKEITTYNYDNLNSDKNNNEKKNTIIM